MALLGTAAATAATAAVNALITDASLHTASPGTTGANEYAGVTRVAVTMTSGANTAGLTWTTSGATAVTHVGGFSAITAGTFELGFPLGSSVTAASITAAIGAITDASS